MRRSEVAARSLSVVCAGALGLAVLGAPSSASAGEEDARSFFAKGRDLRANGKCDEAIVSFRKALETYPEGLGSLRNIAECEEELGRYASARRSYWDLRRAAMQTSEPKYIGWDKDAEAGYKRLEPKVSHVTVQLVGNELERVRVVMDGVPLDPRLVASELERDPGAHVVEAHWGGASPVTERFRLVEAQRQVVTLKIPAALPTPIEKPGERVEDAGAGLRTAGFVALGLGAAGALGLGISIGMRQGALSTIASACPDYEKTKTCNKDVRADIARGETASWMVNIFAGLTLAGVGTGVTLLLLSRDQGEPKAGVQITPTHEGAMGRAVVRF